MKKKKNIGFKNLLPPDGVDKEAARGRRTSVIKVMS
jgi:hypothetical protein